MDILSKISLWVPQKKDVIRIWIGRRMSKLWHFWVNYPFKQNLKEIDIQNKSWEVSVNGTIWSNLFSSCSVLREMCQNWKLYLKC